MFFKNFPIEEVKVLKDEVNQREGEVVSKTLVQNEAISITLFAFSKGNFNFGFAFF